MPQNQVRVRLRDCLHGDNPFTEQPGGCGEQGNHMQVLQEFGNDMKLLLKYQVSHDYLTAVNGSVQQVSGLMFLHNWAKFR